MILVGFLGQSFRQILIYFLRPHGLYCYFWKYTFWSITKQFLLFLKIFLKAWDSKAKNGKIGLEPMFRPYRAQTLGNFFLNELKSYLLYIIVFKLSLATIIWQWQNQMCFDAACVVWVPKKIHPNNISSTFLRSSFSAFSTF